MPVVIVGNITVGGTGKTPLIQHLATSLAQQHIRVGIISRGYGGDLQIVSKVDPQGSPAHFGDEPVLLARSTGCPVFIGRDRAAAGQALLKAHPDVQVILSDDGLQHYRLGRDIELAVIDGQRGWGNGWLLPLGPLRESLRRLASVDAVVVNGNADLIVAKAARRFDMTLACVNAYRLGNPSEKRMLATFAGANLAAVAGIGHPARFFAALRQAKLDFTEHPFADHHPYRREDLAPLLGKTLLVTEKDAVKLLALKDKKLNQHVWVVPVITTLTPDLAAWLVTQLALPSTPHSASKS